METLRRSDAKQTHAELTRKKIFEKKRNRDSAVDFWHLVA